MTRAVPPTVLAIGVDAAEPTVIRAGIARGELSALAALEREGAWRRVDSPARIGSGAVWPTFFTGTDPSEHGMFSYWAWDPAAMRLYVHDASRFVPFWRRVAEDGTTVGVLDVPFAPPVGLKDGFEIAEWGAHDVVHGRMTAFPARARDIVMANGAPHPFSAGHASLTSPDRPDEVAAVAAASVAGARSRGDLVLHLLRETSPALALVVFPEVHRAGHYLWHTAEPEHALFDTDRFRHTDASPGLLDVYREVDRQIGRLVDAAGIDARIAVFSLHGMQATRGTPMLLEPLLRERGFLRTAGWSRQSWKARAQATVGALRKHAPEPVKLLYHRMVSRAARHRLAPTTIVPAYDWSQTRAFPLASDQHGWIRVNLEGREAAGIVARGDYDSTCDDVERTLRETRTTDGRPVVRDVLRLTRGWRDAAGSALPDLVAHWDLAAFDDPVRIAGAGFASAPHAPHFTGQHAFDGFCIVRDRSTAGSDATPVAARDLHTLITAPFGLRATNAARSAR